MHKYTLRETQLRELELLCTFADMCAKHNLCYVLCGGTLLGAIRHKGFIPWDDDIDVSMPRDDFERLLDLSDRGLLGGPEWLRIASWRDKTLKQPYVKIYDTRVTVKEGADTAVYLVEGSGGVHLWIDVFPVDGAPDTHEGMRKICKTEKFYQRLLILSQAKMTVGKTASHRLFKMVFGWIFRLLDPYVICRIMTKMARKRLIEDSDYVACLVGGYGERERVCKKGFFEPVAVEFEGCRFNAPGNYEEYLTSLYHDYMQLPPPEKRIAHGSVVYGD